MKKRVLKALITGIIAGILLTGCASFPEMTEDEYNQTVQYAVSLLMKYSNNGVEKLSSLSSLELERQMEKEAREARKAERDAATAEAIANMPTNLDEEDETDIAQNTEGISDTDTSQDESDIIDDFGEEGANQDTEDIYEDDSELEDIDDLLAKYGDELDQGIANAGLNDTSDDESGIDEIQNEPVQQTTTTDVKDDDGEELTVNADKTVEGMRQEISKGMFLTYSGYSVAGSYPDNDDIFVINATSGKKLLILNFRLANTSGTDVTVDMVKANPHFQVILNGKNVGYTNVTMLDNDLSSFKGTIPAGAKKSMVLIKQMDAGKLKNVDTLGLIGDMGKEVIEFQLE